MDDNHHLGHMVLDCLRKKAETVSVIDAATGESETNASVLSRSIRIARYLRDAGFVAGDILALCGRNHLDVHIPYYAALFNGLPLVGVDPLYKFDEIKSIFKLTSPKIAFCDADKYEDHIRAVQDLGLSTKVIKFGDGENSFKSIIEKYQGQENEDSFELTPFDIDNTYIWLVGTSGSTGKSKVAAFTHRTWVHNALSYIAMISKFPRKDIPEYNPALNLSPIHWISGIFNPVGMLLMSQTMIQTSAPVTTEHVINIINQYKPLQTLLGPSMLSYILKSDKNCDLTCFRSLIIAGGKVDPTLIVEAQKRLTNGRVLNMYGQTETLGPVFLPPPNCPVSSCGQPITAYQVKLIDPETEEEITEPHVNGELWIKGRTFTEYYNCPEETANAFSQDGWYKTGDLLYRDKDNNYYFVERLKMVIKYQNYHIVPAELEEVIRSNPGVSEVVVTSVPHKDDGEHAVACVVRRTGCHVTAQEIKDLVTSKLSEKKQLRGGVVFLGAIPLMSNGKISFTKIKQLALTAHKEQILNC